MTTTKKNEVKETKAVKEKTNYEKLAEINVNDHVEKKASGHGKELTYLSWAWAVDQISRIDPDWSYKILEFDSEGYPAEKGLPYQKILGGYQIQTEVTVFGRTLRMWLPIMDSANRAMKDEPYKVAFKNGSTTTVPAVDAMAINKTIMRCLVKNLGMFGLGLYIYAGEDLPNSDEAVEVDEETGEVKIPAKATAKATAKPKAQSASGAALTHVIQDGPKNKDGENFLKGVQLISFKDGFGGKYSKEITMAILKQGAKDGTEADKKAFAEILKMLEQGIIDFDIKEEG